MVTIILPHTPGCGGVQLSLLRVNEQVLGPALSGNIISFAVAFVLTVAALILVVGYKRASELLIKSIEFGCVEMKHKLLNNAEQKP